MPTCWIIAGPNGAGKTTFALKYLPQAANCQNFVNADLIAAGLAPLAPEREIIAASRLFLREIEYCVTRREDFGFETTLAGRSYLKLINRLKKEGWQVELIYLALPNVQLSKMRVAERVKHGGHDIPLADIERRFSKSLKNLFFEFCFVVDHCECFMNLYSSQEQIFEQEGVTRKIIHQAYFDLLIQEVDS